MVRATLPTVGPAQGYNSDVVPSLPYGSSLMPFTLEKSGSELVIEHLTQYTPPVQQDNIRRVQQSGGLVTFFVGSGVPVVGNVSIDLNLWADGQGAVGTKELALKNFVRNVRPLYFGRNGWYFTAGKATVRTQVRLGGNARNVLPVTIDLELMFPRATNGKPTTLSGYNGMSQRDNLEFDYPIPATTFAWVSPTTLPNAEIGEFYAYRVVAVSDLSVTYSLVSASNPDISVMSNGYIVWDMPVPLPTNDFSVTVRATQAGGATLDRTFTGTMSGNIYTNGGFAIRNGNKILGWGG
jgi:hypothetical protein